MLKSCQSLELFGLRFDFSSKTRHGKWWKYHEAGTRRPIPSPERRGTSGTLLRARDQPGTVPAMASGAPA